MSDLLFKENDCFKVFYDQFMGHGGNGSVYKVCIILNKHTGNEVSLDSDYVIKIYNSQIDYKPERVEKVHLRCDREIKALTVLQGKHVAPELLSLDGMLIFGTDWFVMKSYVTKVNVYFEKTESIAKFHRKLEFFKKLADAFLVLHSNGICHRDLKRNNILLDCDDPLLCDFGLVYMDDTESEMRVTFGNEIIGSPGFIAPELFGRASVKGWLEKDVYTKSDVFALTRLFACSMLGRTFLGECADISGLLQSLKIQGLSNTASNIFKGILSECYIQGTCFNFKNRISVSELKTYIVSFPAFYNLIQETQ